MKVQRYEASEHDMGFAPDGDWVRHADLAPLLSALDAAEGALGFYANDRGADPADVTEWLDAMASDGYGRRARAALQALREARS